MNPHMSMMPVHPNPNIAYDPTLYDPNDQRIFRPWGWGFGFRPWGFGFRPWGFGFGNPFFGGFGFGFPFGFGIPFWI